MTAIALENNNQQSLKFASSESKAVGLGGQIAEYIRNNSARVVGGLYFIATLVTIVHHSPLIVTSSVLGLVAKTILMAYGTKEHQENLAKDKEAKKQKLGEGILANAAKIAHPKTYPIESASAWSVVSNAFYVAFGVEEAFRYAAMPETVDPNMLEQQSKVFASAVTSLVVGGIAMFSYGHMLFGKEKGKKEQKEEEESLKFAESKSEPLGLIGKATKMLKDNPVFAGSIVNIAITFFMFAGGMRAGDAPIAIAGAIALTANIIQAIFVTKKGFNVEGAEEEAEEKAKQGQTFVQRESDRRSVQPEAGRTT